MKITKESAISAGLLVLSLVNQILTMFGHSPLPLENDAAKNIISTVFLIGTSVYAWFSDNPVSKTDCACVTLKKALRKGHVSEEKVRELIAWIEAEELAEEGDCLKNERKTDK